MTSASTLRNCKINSRGIANKKIFKRPEQKTY